MAYFFGWRGFICVLDVKRREVFFFPKLYLRFFQQLFCLFTGRWTFGRRLEDENILFTFQNCFILGDV